MVTGLKGKGLIRLYYFPGRKELSP